MGIRLLFLAIILMISACGHVPQALPNSAQLGSVNEGLAQLTSHSKWYVDGVHGSNRNDCKTPQTACKTIQHGVALSASGDFVIVAPAIYPENFLIRKSVNIVGAGAATTIVDGSHRGQVIVSGNPKAIVTFSGITLRHGGGAGDGGGLYNCWSTVVITDSVISDNHVKGSISYDGYGGAIYNCPGATLTIINTTIKDNSAEAGGAICNGGTLIIINSTFNGNEALRYRGGGIFNYGTVTITNSTFSGNRAPNGIGGGLDNGQLFGSPGVMSVNSSTLSFNSSGDRKGGGVNNITGGRLTLQNTIISNNNGPNCSGTIASKGFNLSSDGTCNFHNSGDLNNTDPKLRPLNDNGGPTETQALRADSPAIDAGNPSGCTDSRGHVLTTDQRGAPRPDKEDAAGCDMGAYERQ